MQNFINTLLKIIKYPLALISIFFFYPLIQSFIHLISQTFSGDLLLYFIAPIGGCIFLGTVIMAMNGSSLTIFAHEATHMLAALLTFHKPVGMKIEEGVGGSFSYKGKGNWLITTAPYFFPTFPVLWMLGSFFLDQQNPLPHWYLITYGALVGYSTISNITQIHGQQTDFKKAGYLFCILFLPGINFLLSGYLWAFATGGWGKMSLWTNIYFPHCQQFLETTFNDLLKTFS